MKFHFLSLYCHKQFAYIYSSSPTYFMLQDHIETERLRLRKLDETDLDDFFRLESNPEVQRYVTAPIHATITSKEQAAHIINAIRQDYVDYGIARWTVLDKNTGTFLGFSGLKFHTEEINGIKDFYELGYRFLPEHWGRGYATESSIAALHYGFATFRPPHIYAFAHIENISSNKLLRKLGFQYTGNFDFKGAPMHWYELKNNLP